MMVDSVISRLTFLLAVGDYPVDGDTKQCLIELCSEVAICEDPQRTSELAKAITALIEKEKQRIHELPRALQ